MRAYGGRPFSGFVTRGGEGEPGEEAQEPRQGIQVIVVSLGLEREVEHAVRDAEDRDHGYPEYDPLEGRLVRPAGAKRSPRGCGGPGLPDPGSKSGAEHPAVGGGIHS